MTATSFLRITAMGAAGINGQLVELTLEDGSTRTVSQKWAFDHNPAVGGYLCEGTAGKWFAKDSSMGPLIVRCVAVEVAKLELQAGDVLAVKVDRPLSAERIDSMSFHLRKLLPKGVNVMFTQPGTELAVLKAGTEEMVPL